MLRAKPWQQSLSLLGLSLVLTILPLGYNEPGWSKPTDKNNQEEGLPGRRVGGGSRRCNVNGVNQPCPPIMALVPEESLTLTATDTPTLFLDFPTIDDQKPVQVELVVRDESDRLVYEQVFTVLPAGKLIGFEIAKNQIFGGMQAGKNYLWYLSVIHDPRDRSRDEVVEGWIRYQPLDSAINGLSPLEQASLYESNRRWTDAVETLVTLREKQGDDPQILQAWQNLLGQLNLPPE